MTALQFDTPVTRLLGIRIPLLQGAMAWLSEAPMVAAVSNQGGLGVLGASLMSVAELEAQVLATKALTTKPFGVNFPLVLGEYGEHLDMALSHGVRIIVMSAGSPRKFTARIHAAGAVCVHVVPNLKLALSALDAGVDAIVVESVEAGGHVSTEGITGFTNIPNLRAHLKVPLIAAGGITSGAGMAAAMALGADGVQMGTRFLATVENNAAPIYKQMVTGATEFDTPVYSRNYHPGRALKSPTLETILAMEKAGHGNEEVRTFIGRGRAKKAAHDGNLQDGMFYSGAGAVNITEVLTVAQVFERVLAEYAEAVARLHRLAGLR
jgi:enoyl-[acyl-carrier protein] reductase II